MTPSTTVTLLAWINRVVITLMLLAVGWGAWIALQNWHGISV